MKPNCLFGIIVRLSAISIALPSVSHASESNLVERTTESLLNIAFENRYALNLTSTVELEMKDHQGGEQRRKIRVASKIVDGQVHSLARLKQPIYLRGMTILTIENHDRGHDAFIYLPSLQRIRRITTSQRGDSFFGSDVTYEDLERLRVGDFEVGKMTEKIRGGESVLLIRARPKRKTTYSRILFVISAKDFAILETQYFKLNQEEPFRVFTAPREGMIEKDGHVIPTRFHVVDKIRRSSTDITFTNLEINPPLDDRLFSLRTLESRRPLP